MKKAKTLGIIATILIGFYSNAQEITELPNGNVGIGINPEQKLDVMGITFLRGATGYDIESEQLRIGRSDNGSVRYHSIFSKHSGGPYNNYLLFKLHTGGLGSAGNWDEQVDVMVLNGKGNVGIGTIEPTEKLSIQNGSIGIGDIKNDNWSKYTHIVSDGYGYDFQYDNASIITNEHGTTNQAIVLGDVDHSSNSPLFGIALKTSTTEWEPKFTVTGKGNVGIGTTEPTEKLSIQDGSIGIGDIKNDNWSKYTHIASDGYGYDFQYDNASIITNEHGTTNQAIVLGDVNHSSNSPLFGIALKTSTTEWEPKFTVTGKGNVGIGTIDPKNELSVNGTIWAKEVKIRLTDAADWVFDDSYKLTPLEEVENYIKENKHLPEIPSAEEFRKNDLKISEMTNKLLQKIEELTLYTIEQQKEIINLRKRLDKIEN